jgi:hypothetical protein
VRHWRFQDVFENLIRSGVAAKVSRLEAVRTGNTLTGVPFDFGTPVNVLA